MPLIDWSKVTLPVCFCGHGEEKHWETERCVAPHCDCLCYKPFHEEVWDERFSLEQ